MDASYSNGYCFTKPDGDKQFFLAEVLLGDTAQLGANGQLRNPPNKPDGTMYDSVTGGRIVMIYQNCKAYPRYLVTYTC